MSTDMRELSRTRWTTRNSRIEDINCGSLLRIADATEKMAQRHIELIAQRDQFEQSMNYWRDAAAGKDYKIRALKGQITKLKKAKTL